jgi:serine/threonine-protein kinase RsbW
MNAVTPCEMELRIPRRPEFVRVARMAACTLASVLDFTYDTVKDIELAVGEACANAVEHAGGVECETILVRFRFDHRHLAVEVIDRGPGFDITEIEAEDSGKAKSGGLGLVVIQSVMDQVEIRCDAQSGTCVRMVKYRAA